jgi:hypothetical protein
MRLSAPGSFVFDVEPGRALRGWALAATLAAASASAAAQSAVTLYGGARGGGGFVDQNHGDADVNLASGAAVSLSIDWPFAVGRPGQVFYSFQRSAMPGAAFGRSSDVPLNISYLHLGGRVFFDGGVASQGGYVVGGLGVTHFSPGLDGLSAELRPSMNLGVGYQWPLGKQVALRGELRSYLSLINSSGGFFCSGGCVAAIRGDTMVQVEALFGIAVGF